ncbi:MAG: hypothetical protein WA741_29755 [Candidatus Sulfotelmatobacter sp.]
MDSAYKKYIAEAIAVSDRFAFDLASIEFLATLHNGHSGFDDDWLNKHYGRSFGFYARPLGARWVVTESAISDLKAGDIIERIDGAPMMEVEAHLLPPVCCSESTWSQSGHLVFVSLTRAHEPPTLQRELRLDAKAEPFLTTVPRSIPSVGSFRRFARRTILVSTVAE